MITGRQIRAARALLEWDAKDVADKIGVNLNNLLKVERGEVQPQRGTVSKIVNFFARHDIEFIEGGARQRPRDVEIFEGIERFEDFYAFMYDHLEELGGDVCLSAVNEKLFRKHRTNFEHHKQRMKELVDSGRVTFRALATESYFTKGYVEYRWQPAQSSAPTAFYAFGNCLALITFEHNPPPYVILIKSAPMAEAYRTAFNLAWNNASEPPEQAKE